MRVAVIGGGIGGLAVARGLQAAGADVTVFERSTSNAISGSGLSLFANGVRALDALGYGEALSSISGKSSSRIMAGQRLPSGKWLARTPDAAVSQLRIVHRVDLSEMLATALRPGTVWNGADVKSVSPDGRGLLIRGTDGHDVAHHPDMIVAADGIRSAVRRAHWPDDCGLRYSGYTAWRGVTSRPVDVLGVAGETWGLGRRFGIAPLRDGRVYWFGVANASPGTVFENEFDTVHQMFGHWHDPIRALLDSTIPEAVFRHDIYDLASPLSTFTRGAIALLGDAAHAMTPDLGQGANQALEDAATLVALLAPIARESHPDPKAVSAALRRYDTLRRPRTQAIAKRARALGGLAQLEHPFGATIRNLAIRLTPTRAIARQMLAIQAWHPNQVS